MYSSPCLDHTICTLDLAKLRAEIRAVEQRAAERSALWAKVAAAREALRQEPLDESRQKAHDDAWRKLREFEARSRPTYATFLYSIRAHHRGRIHRLWERLPDGQVKSLTLEDQARWILEERALLEPFLRKPTNV